MKIRNITACIMLALFLLSAQYSESVENTVPEPVSVGEILSVENEATVTRSDASEVAAKTGLSLFAGDNIVTGETGKVRFSLNQDNLFALGPSSEMAIDELSELEADNGQQPVIRLMVGFLRSAIKGLTGDSDHELIHTPTVTAGIRGTEFDTVVSSDGATVIVVDEGRVAVDAETAKAVLAQGEMIESDTDTTALKPVSAVPRAKRNWKEWRGKRKKAMLGKLSRMVPQYRKRFEKWEARYTDHLANVRKAEKRVLLATEQVRKAEEAGNSAALQQSLKHLEEESRVLKHAVKKSRRHHNRLKAMGRHLKKIGKYAKKHKNHFNKKELAAIHSDIRLVSEKRKHLKSGSRKLISDLRKTLKKAKKYKKKSHHKKKDKKQHHHDKEARLKKDAHKDHREKKGHKDHKKDHREKKKHDEHKEHKKRDPDSRRSDKE